jgi:hypothetical protein
MHLPHRFVGQPGRRQTAMRDHRNRQDRRGHGQGGIEIPIQNKKQRTSKYG